MVIKDILFTFASDLGPAPVPIVDSGVSPASSLGAHLAAVHIRFRELIRGGATGSMQSKPLLPIQFSH
jgi:hypothetical protein